MLVTSKYLRCRRIGPDLTLNAANAPWLSKVLKLTVLTAPNSSGLNARTSYTGGYGGATMGGTLQTLAQGQDFELVAGIYDGWTLPDTVAGSTLSPATAANTYAGNYSDLTY